MTRPAKRSMARAGIEPKSTALKADANEAIKQPSKYTNKSHLKAAQGNLSSADIAQNCSYSEGREKDCRGSSPHQPGPGIMESDDRQVTTVFTVQPSFHHRHSTNRVS